MTKNTSPISKDEIRKAYNILRSDPPFTNSNSSIIHHRVLPIATYSPWLNDQDFMGIYNSAKENTLVDIYRCYELWNLAKQSMELEGNILEVGVWRGGTGSILAKAVEGSGKTVFLADTFSGVVKAGPLDTNYKGGEHSDTSFELVNDFLISNRLHNFKLLKGIFPEDSGHLFEGSLALLHCDVDVYSSSNDIVQWCMHKLSPGGVLVFDDYGFSGCEGVTRYCNELRLNKKFIFIHNLNGHAIFIKK
jgi:O-methyltransferase